MKRFAPHSTVGLRLQHNSLNGTFSGTFAVDSFGMATLKGRGKFNHLGASTFSASAPCAGPIPFTITAADGAGLSLSLALTGVAFTSSTTAVFSLTYAIDGGSGHLADAAGPGTMSVAIVATDATLTGGKLSGTLAGTMTE